MNHDIDQHEPIQDCDCHACAIAERNRLREALNGKQALDRVIAEQQKEIDRLRLMEKNNAERWQHENKSVERMALAAFGVLNHPESPECHFELKQAVMAMGFCPLCEWRPCECGDED
jgi:hypothetical protein